MVNWEPFRIESGSGKGGAQTYLKQCPGLVLVANIGTEIRGLKAARGRLFAVNEDRLMEIHDDYTTTASGFVAGGVVEMDDNETQLCIVATPRGYALDLTSGVFTSILSHWPDSNTVSVLDGYGILTPPDTNKFYLTTSNDFTTLDPLDFASAETSPGDIMGQLVKHRQLLILKERSGEVWYDSGGVDFAFTREESAVIEVGCAARRSLRKIGGVAYWVGRDENGSAVVFGMAGYEPQRISSDALEELLGGVSDDNLAQAWAWVYHQEGQSRYVLNVPSINTTWVYNASAGIWHERGEWNGTNWNKWRANYHAYAFGKHIVADNDGNIYEMSTTANKYGADVLRRNWRSPHNASPQSSVQRFSSFEVLCDVGVGLPDGTPPTLLMRYSNDGGNTWQDWIALSLGSVGQTLARARAIMLGAARDRVWEIAITDDVQCNPVSVLVNER